MTDQRAVDPAELARQLRDPEGAAGLAVIGGLAQVNAEGSAAVLARLDLGSGMAVLELGCGLGDLAAPVIGAGEGVRYIGLDRSATMIEAAAQRHAETIASGGVEFHQATSEATPFAPATFDRAFSIGLIHFWADPLASLREVRRVLCAGGLMVMGCLGPDRAPPFASAENGFFLRSGDEWRRLCSEAGFAEAAAELSDEPGRPQGLLVTARAQALSDRANATNS